MNNEQGATGAMEALDPIVIDLGKAWRKRIKGLKRGRGKLMDKVERVMDKVRAQLRVEGDEKVAMPLIVLYHRKTKKRRRRSGFLGF